LTGVCSAWVHQLHHEGLLVMSRVLVGTQNDGGAGQGNGLSWTAMISAAGQSEATVSLSRLMHLQKELKCRFNRDRRTMA